MHIVCYRENFFAFVPVHGARRTAAPVYTPEVDETDPDSSFQHSSLTAEQKRWRMCCIES